MSDHRLTELMELSARLGSQPLLVQGSTGNTSIKIGRILWIKASGKRLENAASEDMFVPVNLQGVEHFISQSSSWPDAARPTSSGLTPSIETAMHLVLPHRVVIHLHSVNTIAWAVQRDGASHLREILSGLRWTWIDYMFSGAPLARAIRASLSFSPDVFILANHGLVIGAETCGEAMALLAEIEKRLAIEPRKIPEPNRLGLARWAAAADYKPAESDVINSLATDPISMEILAGGILYPCQAMFLGRYSVVTERAPLAQLISDFIAENAFRPPAIFVKGDGVLVAEDHTVAEAEVLTGLAQVARRIPAPARVQYLSRRCIDEVVSNNLYAGTQSRMPSNSLNIVARAKAASR